MMWRWKAKSLLLMEEEEINDEQKPLYAGHIVAVIERVCWANVFWVSSFNSGLTDFLAKSNVVLLVVAS